MDPSQQVTVQLRADVAAQLAGAGEVDEEAAAVRRAVDERGVSLAALDPRSADPQLRTFFVVDAPDAETAEQVRDALAALAAVDAAYVKPPDALP